MTPFEILIVILLIYTLCVINKDKKQNKESYTPLQLSNKLPKNKKEYLNNNIANLNNLNKIRAHVKKNNKKKIYDNIGKELNKYSIHPHVVEIKFHNDFRDVQTALNNLVPSQRQVFNIPNIPVEIYKPQKSEIQFMINDFIDNLNKVLCTVPKERHVNSGWDESIPDPNMVSGSTKYRESLGLPPSLYDNPDMEKKVYLINVNDVDKYETEDEIRYIFFIIIGKEDVEDQMLLKASFIQDKKYNENTFFDDNEEINHMVIEELTIVCFLTKYGEENDPHENNIENYNYNNKDYYDFQLLDNTNVIDNNTIINELTKKYKQRMETNNYRLAMLDEDGFNTLPYVASTNDYDSYNATRSIIHDMKAPVAFS
jgi:hypothetical protein